MSSKVAGLPPAQTNTMSASRSVLVPQSGMMATPFEAMTGLPPGAACHQRYRARGRERDWRRAAARSPRHRTSGRSPAPAGSPTVCGAGRGACLYGHVAKCQASGVKCQSGARRAQRWAMRYSAHPPRSRPHRQPRLEAALARARAQARIRRGDRRRRRSWARHGLLSRQGARHHQCRGGGEVLSRLGQCRAQHHHHPLQLSARPAICRSTNGR